MLKKLSILSLHLLMLALVVAIAAYWVVKILTPVPLAAPPPPPAAVQREANPILAARLFGLVQTAPTPAASNIQLVGVFAAGRNSSAIIAADGKPARVVLLGQPVVAGTRLAAVSRDGVTLDRDGAKQELKMPPRPQPESKAQQPAPAAFTRDGNTLSAPSKGPPAAAAANNPLAPAVVQPQPAPVAPLAQTVPTPPPPPVVPADLPPAGAAAPVSTAPHPAPGRRARRGSTDTGE